MLLPSVVGVISLHKQGSGRESGESWQSSRFPGLDRVETS